MRSFPNALAIAICVSLAVHVGAVALTLKSKPELEVAGAGETTTVTLGSSPFSTISAGSTPQVEATQPMERAVEETPPIAPPSETSPAQSLESVSATAAKPVPAIDTNRAVESVPIVAAGGNYQAAAEQNAVAENVEKSIPEKHRVEPVELKTTAPKTDVGTVQTEPVRAVAEDPRQILKEVALPPVSAKPVEQATLVEPLETTVSTPRRKPPPPKRQTAKTQKKPETKTAKKPTKNKQEKAQSARRAGAGGQSNRTAQKGGSARKGKAKAAGNSEVTNYPAKVHRKVLRSVRTPRSIGRLAKDAQVRFTVTANGGVTGVRLVSSSGNKAFDQAALKSVQRAAPYPAIPAAAKRASWTFTLPIGTR